MKNQYVADIGDYGKYVLLKAFTDAGVKLGVNWYLTPDDLSNDGKFTDYLEEDKHNVRRFAPEVYDTLREIYRKDRTVTAVERSGLLKGAVFFNEEVLPMGGYDPHENRTAWYRQAEEKLGGSELVFLDPDNGLIEGDVPESKAAKYVIYWEVVSWFENCNVVYYCHKGRRTPKQWEEYKAKMFMTLPAAQPIILTYHKGTQRSYVFLVHPKDYERYREITDRVVEQWEGVFTKESIQEPYLLEKHSFAVKWAEIFQKDYEFYKIFDNMEFSAEASLIGLVMDAEHSFCETFPEAAPLGNPETLKPILKDEKMTPRLLGAAIYSHWRYFNHWANAEPTKDEIEWFILALNRLVELTKGATP